MLSEYQDRLERSQSVVFAKVSQVKVGEMEQIRDALFEQGLQMQVAKNSLLKQTLAKQETTVPEELLDQPVALIYSYEDVVVGPKTMAPLLKEIEALEVLGGLMGSQYITASEVSQLASLPSREQLLGQVVGTMQAPISGFVNVLAGNIRNLVNVLSRISETKQA